MNEIAYEVEYTTYLDYPVKVKFTPDFTGSAGYHYPRLGQAAMGALKINSWYWDTHELKLCQSFRVLPENAEALVKEAQAEVVKIMDGLYLWKDFQRIWEATRKAEGVWQQ